VSRTLLLVRDVKRKTRRLAVFTMKREEKKTYRNPIWNCSSEENRFPQQYRAGNRGDVRKGRKKKAVVYDQVFRWIGVGGGKEGERGKREVSLRPAASQYHRCIEKTKNVKGRFFYRREGGKRRKEGILRVR